MTAHDPQLARLEKLLLIIVKQGSFIMSDLSTLSTKVDAQNAAVSAVKTAIDNAIGLLQALKARGDAADQTPAIDALGVKVDAVTSDLAAAGQQLSAAVTANTP
jgi:hypothetical protein